MKKVTEKPVIDCGYKGADLKKNNSNIIGLYQELKSQIMREIEPYCKQLIHPLSDSNRDEIGWMKSDNNITQPSS